MKRSRKIANNIVDDEKTLREWQKKHSRSPATPSISVSLPQPFPGPGPRPRPFLHRHRGQRPLLDRC